MKSLRFGVDPICCFRDGQLLSLDLPEGCFSRMNYCRHVDTGIFWTLNEWKKKRTTIFRKAAHGSPVRTRAPDSPNLSISISMRALSLNASSANRSLCTQQAYYTIKSQTVANTVARAAHKNRTRTARLSKSQPSSPETLVTRFESLLQCLTVKRKHDTEKVFWPDQDVSSQWARISSPF